MDRFKTQFRVANSIALFLIAGALLVNHSQAAPATAPLAAITSTTFSYEGRLGSVSGRYDFQFRLFADTSSTTPVVTTVVAPQNVLVDSGEYVVPLNFGVAPFSGDARYLEVKYRVHTTTANAPYT